MGTNEKPMTPKPPLRSYPVARLADPELAIAAQLIDVLIDMRERLDLNACRRVLLFALERCGISFVNGAGLIFKDPPIYPPPADDHGKPHLNEA